MLAWETSNVDCYYSTLWMCVCICVYARARVCVRATSQISPACSHKLCDICQWQNESRCIHSPNPEPSGIKPLLRGCGSVSCEEWRRLRCLSADLLPSTCPVYPGSVAVQLSLHLLLAPKLHEGPPVLHPLPLLSKFSKEGSIKI